MLRYSPATSAANIQCVVRCRKARTKAPAWPMRATPDRHLLNCESASQKSGGKDARTLPWCIGYMRCVRAPTARHSYIETAMMAFREARRYEKRAQIAAFSHIPSPDTDQDSTTKNGSTPKRHRPAAAALCQGRDPDAQRGLLAELR